VIAVENKLVVVVVVRNVYVAERCLKVLIQIRTATSASYATNVIRLLRVQNTIGERKDATVARRFTRKSDATVA
tara:strand:- start:1958 stop:2179 length:222 start_codon:yes stop_codon:yes gene_type:complete